MTNTVIIRDINLTTILLLHGLLKLFCLKNIAHIALISVPLGNNLNPLP
jgi:hypothetical protein